jgi:hypothetical protein
MHERTGKSEDKIMMTFKSSNHKFNARLVYVTLLTGAIAGATLLAGEGPATQEADHTHADHGHAAPAKLVQLVRDATKRFVDVNAATAAGYQPFLGCVSGPDHGAMGFHYVNGALVGDGILDASQPEVLIYEASNGGLQLVGVEFVVIAQTWQANHTTPPVLEGQTFLFVDSPNRYGLPAHYELHVWAWRDNPNGAFVDWNNKVSCEGE